MSTAAPNKALLPLLVLLAAALFATGEYSALGPQRRANAAATAQLAALRQDNDRLRPLAAQVPRLQAENAQLQRQWEQTRALLPAQRSSDEFLRRLDQAARSTQVAIRVVTAQPAVTRALYQEAPYSLQLDGSFVNLLRFYDQLAHLQPLLTVGDWNVSALATATGAHAYQYRPGTTIHAACQVSTFFSTEAK